MRALASVLFAGALLLVAPRPASAEMLTMALSTEEIRIDSNFTGTTLTIFGVIERDATTVSRASTYEVAIALRGPAESFVVRRKDRILGIWANAASETILGAPSFYAIASSKPLEEVSTEPLLKRFAIGFDSLHYNFGNRGALDNPETREFRDAFLRLKRESGLYVEQPNGVSFIGDAVFRATIWIPANVPDGLYTANVYLFSGDALLAQESETITITKTGFEQYVYAVSRNYAAAYGLACVALAIFTGWLAGVIFRRD